MKNIFLTTSIFISSLSFSQSYQIVKFDKVENILNSKNDTLYILNFWASWCQPCVKELPYFEQLNEQYKTKKVKIILISIDFKSDLKERVEPFLDKKKLHSTVWYLDETNQNEFIPKVEENWTGAIPFTLMKRGADQVRYSKEGKFSLKDLNMKIASFL